MDCAIADQSPMHHHSDFDLPHHMRGGRRKRNFPRIKRGGGRALFLRPKLHALKGDPHFVPAAINQVFVVANGISQRYINAGNLCCIMNIVQGDPNRNFLFQMPVTLKLCISDPMLVKPKCV